jgi:AFG3 family protein
MSFRLALRAVPARSPRSLRPIQSISQFSRSYASPAKPPSNPPPPAGLEGLFGGSDKKGGTTVAPKPPGVEPSGPSHPKTPDVKLPGGQEGAEKPVEEAEDKPLKDRRPKLSEQMMGLAGKKTATGGGGGGSGGGGGAGGPNQWGMTPNQLLLAVLA